MAVPSNLTSTRTAQVTEVLHTLLEQAVARLTTPVGLVVLSPGQSVVWDDCCNGQLWARIVNIQPWMSGTQGPKPNVQCYQMGWTISAAIGVIRCVHTVTEDGALPTDAELYHDFNALAVDMEDLSKALLCDFAPLPEVERFQLQTWSPALVQAGCAGGEWSFIMQLGYCGC